MLPSLAKLAHAIDATRKPSKPHKFERRRIEYNPDGSDAFKSAFRDVANYAASVPHVKIYSPDKRRIALRPKVVPIDVFMPTEMEPVIPPPPTRDGDDAYAYLFHRPGDSTVPYPDGVKRIVASGGVGAHVLRPVERWELFDTTVSPWVLNEEIGNLFSHILEAGEEAGKRHDGMSLTYKLELVGDKDAFDAKREKMKNLTPEGEITKFFNWFYMSVSALSNVSDAWEDELMFRVPKAWLEANGARSLSWSTILITRAIVPLVYRTTEPWPEQDETRSMSIPDVHAITHA
jgi:hypothetical protein